MEGDVLISITPELLSALVSRAYSEGWTDREYASGSSDDEWYYSVSKENLEKILNDADRA